MSAGPPPVPGGRSDDERERARIEREARRTGRPVTPAARRESSQGNGQVPRPSNGQRPRPSAPRRHLPGRDPRVVAALERRKQRTARDGGDADGRGGGRGRHRAPRQPGGANFRARRLFLLAGALLLVLVAWFLISLYQPFAGDPGARKTVTIKKQSSVGDIGHKLADEGIVSSAFFFEVRATLSGKRGALKPGTYSLRENMTYADAIAALEKGPPANTVNITVPEGRSRSEIAASIAQSGLKGNYKSATRRSAKLDPSSYGAKGASDLEGFLWPSTYQLKRGQSVRALVDKQLTTFRQNFGQVSMSKAKAKNLTPYEVLTIASLVERETAVPRERRLIASVIYNRLAQDQSLGIDATVRFFTGNWDKPLTESQLQTPNPYNTRINKGLPPGPIGNPGLASIRAAADPATSDYLFYVANPCKPGTHTFTKTLAEFNAAAARYNQARQAAGGKAPKGC